MDERRERERGIMAGGSNVSCDVTPVRASVGRVYELTEGRTDEAEDGRGGGKEKKRKEKKGRKKEKTKGKKRRRAAQGWRADVSIMAVPLSLSLSLSLSSLFRSHTRLSPRPR